MKIVQQDFKIMTPILFFIMLIANIGITNEMWSEYKKETILMKIFMIVSVIMSGYFCYKLSYIYEFKKEMIILKPFFGIYKKDIYLWKNLTKIENCINYQNKITEIKLYFNYKNKVKIIGLSMFPNDIEKIKLFLYANVENFEELVE